MHPLLKISCLVVLVLAILTSENCQAQTSWNFQYSYSNVFAPNVLQYVVGQTNIERSNEGDGNTYWNPITNGIPATLIQEFQFAAPSAAIYLSADISSFNFGGENYGSGSLWASRDGVNWVNLIQAPTPAYPGYEYGYNYIFTTNLPSSLLGTDQIYIKTELQTSGWDILAQFMREGDSNDPVFALDATYTLPQVNFVKAFTVDYSNLLIGSNYQAQASPDLVTWTNWGAAFTATSSTYTNTDYQRIANWNQLFFRLVQQ